MRAVETSSATTSALTVALLGPLRAEREGERVRLGPAGQRAVFAILALRSNQVVSREELISAVWGDEPPTSAVGILYNYVSALRRALDPTRARRASGDDLLASVGSGYSLRLDPATIDLVAFDELRKRAQERHDAGDAESELGMLNSALQLWRGEALEDVPGPYAAAQRRRLAELRIATIERRCRAMLELGAYTEVADELAALIREHPFRQSLHIMQMLALFRSDRKDDALAVFHDARRVLVSELGLEPGPELQRLNEQILAGDPSLDPALPRIRPGRVAGNRQAPDAPLSVVPSAVLDSWKAAPSTLAGRGNEVGTLKNLLADLANGHGRAVWIEGEAGIGKSELLTVGLSAAKAMGFQVAWSAAEVLLQRFPLHAMLETLGARSMNADPRVAVFLERLARAGANGESPGTANPQSAVIDQLTALVEQLCADGPLVLVLDDMQWADDASLLTWYRLASAAPRLRLLLVGASRPEQKRPKLAQLRDSVQAHSGLVISLDALPPEHERQLVIDMTGAEPGPRLMRLASRAAGNPLYLRELVDSLVLAGQLVFDNGRAELAAGTSERQTPASLASAVRRRLEVLSADTQQALRWAALLGNNFALGELARLIDRSPSSLLGAIDEAIYTKVLVDSGTTLAFRHPLVRQVLYDRMPTAVRVALHRQAAEVFAADGAPVDRIADQLTAVPVPVDAWVAEWLRNHAAELINRAPTTALELLERVAQTSFPELRRVELNTDLAKALARLGRSPEAPARAVLSETKDPELASEMQYLLATALHRKGLTEEAVAALHTAADDPAVLDLWRARL